MKQLLNGCLDALENTSVIIQAIITMEQKSPHNIYQQSRLGCHIRHIVDHFIALQQGIDERRIDYNLRHRNSPVETEPDTALKMIAEIQQQLLQKFSGTFELDDTITVISEIDCYQTLSQTFGSTIGRELLYLINHTIHHTAYIKLLVKPYGIILPDHIGIAPSTATFLRNQE